MVHMTGHATPLREYIGGADESRGGRPFINQVALTRGTNYGLALMPIETMGMLAYTSLLPLPWPWQIVGWGGDAHYLPG